MLHCKECIENGRIGANQRQYQANPGVSMTPGVQGGYYPQGQHYQQPLAYGGYYPQYPYAGYGYYPRYGYGVQRIQPRPKGTPNINLFKGGTIGCIIGAVVALVNAFIVSGMMMFNIVRTPSPLFASSLLMVIALLPLSAGIFGYYRNFGSEWGLFGSIGMVISGIAYLILVYLSLINGDSWEYAFIPDFIMFYFAHLFFGIGLLLAGIAVSQSKRYLEIERQMQGLQGPAGIGLIIGGALFMVLIGVFIVGWIVITISLMILSMEFHKTKVPNIEDKGLMDKGSNTGQGPGKANQGANPYQGVDTSPKATTDMHGSTLHEPPTNMSGSTPEYIEEEWDVTPAGSGTMGGIGRKPY